MTIEFELLEFLLYTTSIKLNYGVVTQTRAIIEIFGKYGDFKALHLVIETRSRLFDTFYIAERGHNYA